MNDRGAASIPVGRGMVLSHLTIRNFRSCYDTAIPLRPDVTVLVGENNSGKSNVIQALRLALTPAGARRTRYFELEDRSFGCPVDEPTELSLVFSDLTSVQRGQFVTALDLTDMSVRYSTRFMPDPERPTRSRPAVFVGPGDAPESEPERRADLQHVYLEPLRDAQRELDSSSSRRLALIIELLHGPERSGAFVDEVNEKLRDIEDHEVVAKTRERTAAHLDRLTQPVRAQSMGLKFEDYRLQRLVAALRFKMAETGIDLADLAESGLGYANLLYIATVLLQLDNASDAELTVVLVEEPEAHLHPQLQSVLLDYLREQAAESGDADTVRPVGRIQVVVTTHSPLLAASVGVENIVVLRSMTKPSTSGQAPDADLDNAIDPNAADAAAPHDEAASDAPIAELTATSSSTVAVAVAHLGLDARDTRKLDQYLDATKAALLFGTRVVLVEGVSEAVLLPVIARRLYAGSDPESTLRRRAIPGLTIVAVGSVDFEPYIRLLLGRDGEHSVLDRLVVITDDDPLLDGEDPDPDVEDDEELLPVEEASIEPDERITDGVVAPSSVRQPAPRVRLLRRLATEDHRLVVRTAELTLEADLLAEPGNEPTLRAAFLDQKPRSAPMWAAFTAAENPAEALYRHLRSHAGYLAKGQFAHDLAGRLTDGEPFSPPAYLREAIEAALT